MKKLFIFGTVLACLLVFFGCSTTGSLSPTIQEVGLSLDPIPLAAAPQTITPEQAKEIALNHAGFAAADVSGLRAEYDREDNHWDVDFRTGDWEYDYDIHADTGVIVKAVKDYEPVKSTPPSPTEVQPAATRLTAEEAKAIALKHAGLAEEQVRSLRVEFETERGVPKYEVDFVSNGWEYEYDIHAETGEILSFEKGR